MATDPLRDGESLTPTSTIRVSTFSDLHSALEPYRSELCCMFRGQGDASWKLVPKAGRTPFDSVEDDSLFASWKSDAIQYISEKPRTELEWLALAQHHGLATRLLDWTLNPLVAAFFAVWEDRESDAALFAFVTPEILCHDYPESPFAASSNNYNVIAWWPDPITSRIGRQQSLFTLHEPATQPLYILDSHERLECILIAKEYRATLREQLAYYGITRASLFPDLDGISNHHNWKIQEEFRKIGRFMNKSNPPLLNQSECRP